jgi:hypothetical protein
LFAIGFACVFRRWLVTGFDGIIGDDSDGQILIAIVTHWDRVFAGQAYWADPSFFYPERGTLGFTDALFLYGLPHAALRALGIDVFTALMVVMAALSAIGFFGFVRLARRHFAMTMPSAVLGAFLFTFGNMIAASLVHAQIYCAMLLPAICDLALTAWRAAGRRSIVAGAAAGLLHALVFLTGYQTAWFFTFLVFLFALLHPLVFGFGATRALLREAFGAKRRVLIAYGGAFAAGIVPFLMLYLPVLRSGRHRGLAEVFSNAPDASDFLNVTTGNFIWGELLRQLGITGRANRPWWEVDLGFTPAVLVMLLATTFALVMRMRCERERATERDRWLIVLAVGALLSALLQLDYLGFRPWTLIWAAVPGAGGIRYTMRSQAVANLFAALVAARGLDGLCAFARGRKATIGLVTGLAVFMLAEQVNVDWPPTISRRETAAWIDAVPPPPQGCRVFYLVPRAEPADRDGWIHQAYAMLFSQVRGIPTVNGYSSWLPENWDLEEPAKPGYAAAVRNWARAKGVQDLCGVDLTRAIWSKGLPD